MARETHIRRHHGHSVEDPFAWFRNLDRPEVRSHLDVENAWHDAVMAERDDLTEAIFNEIRGRIVETDLSVPVKDGSWWYYERTEEGLDYAIACRKPATPDDVDEPPPGRPETVLLDPNLEAGRLGGGDYFSIGALDVSPDECLLAWSVDPSGSEEYTLRIRDIATGGDLTDVIEGVGAGVMWAGDSDHIFYVREDAAKRPFQVWRHRIGTAIDDDTLVFTETDERFWVGVGVSRDLTMLYIQAGSKTTTEIWMLEADDPLGEFRCIEPRADGHEYSVTKHEDRLFVTTNCDGAVNGKLMVTPLLTPGREHWIDVIGHRDGVRFDGAEAFADHLVLHERVEGSPRLTVRRLSDGHEHEVFLEHALSTIGTGVNPDADTRRIVIMHASMAHPDTIEAYDLDSRERSVLKTQHVPGDFDPSDLTTERQWATAPDGVSVPISLVRRADVTPGPETPTVVYGYGAYEACLDSWFSPARLSLLDRGFTFAVAHVRGGGEMGREWYEAGRLHQKSNSFSDLAAVVDHLVDTGQTSHHRVVLRGGSAGGLLVAGTAAIRPDIARAIVAEVPFVDPLNTILDPELPLTVTEWEEWGNPIEDPEIYRLMASYSPYENPWGPDGPAVYATAGLNDSRVSYWEPAKWVAALRENGVADHDVILRTEMGAGHGGASGRYDAWREEATVLAWIISRVGDTPA